MKARTKEMRFGTKEHTYPSGRNANIDVYATVQYTDDGELTFGGVEGPWPNGNCAGSVGQISKPAIAEFALGWDQYKLDMFFEMWHRWHLSRLRPGCEHQRQLGWDKRKLDDNKPIGWSVNADHANMARWVTPEEHPRGVMGKPCPICGYKHGTAWLVETVPEEYIAWIWGLPDSDKENPWPD